MDVCSLGHLSSIIACRIKKRIHIGHREEEEDVEQEEEEEEDEQEEE